MCAIVRGGAPPATGPPQTIDQAQHVCRRSPQAGRYNGAMRRWGLLGIVCTACGPNDDPPPILTLGDIASDCATTPVLEDRWITDWIGLPEGCAVTIGLSLDLARMPSDAVVHVRTPNSGTDATPVFDAAGHAEVAFTTPMLAGTAWRDADAVFAYGLYNPARTLEYGNLGTIIVRPSAAPSAWLWDTYWFNANRHGERYYDHECDDPLSIIVWVGGTAAPGTYVKVSVFDVDVGTDTLLEDGIVPIDGPGRYAYAPTHLCDPDREGATADNVDPRFDVTIFDASDTKLDMLPGTEIDL